MKSAAHHQGLSEQQVQENRTRYGVNILTPPEKEPLWKQFLEKFSDPIIKILLVALLLSVGVACYQFLTGAESASVFLEPACWNSLLSPRNASTWPPWRNPPCWAKKSFT